MSTRRNYKSYFGSREGCAKVISIPIRTRHRIKRRWSAVDRVGLNNNTQPNLQCHNTSVGKSNEDLDDNLHPSLHQLNMNEDGEVSESGLSTTSDDDDDEDDYDQNKHHNKQYKIFPGAKLTTTESCMLILGFAIRHKLSKSAMSDLLTLINFHLPPGASIPSSMFLLNKMLGPDYTLAKKIPFCEKCQCIIENSDNCIKCGQVNVHKAIKDGNYFVSFDIGSVLKSLLEREAISNSIIKTFVKRANNPDASNVISDIVDGADYKKLKLKKKHTILGGLWLGKGKPNFSLFLNPFMKQAAQLSTEGIVWTANNKMMTSKIFCSLFAADSVARCQIQGINQFNGEYSCPWCLAKGQNLKISDSRHKWIFDPTEISVKRDKEIFVKHLLQLRDKLKQGSKIASNFRIKVASPLVNLQNFDINMFDINLMPVIHNSAYSFLHNQLCREVVPVYAGFAMPFSYGKAQVSLCTIAIPLRERNRLKQLQTIHDRLEDFEKSEFSSTIMLLKDMNLDLLVPNCIIAKVKLDENAYVTMFNPFIFSPLDYNILGARVTNLYFLDHFEDNLAYRGKNLKLMFKPSTLDGFFARNEGFLNLCVVLTPLTRGDQVDVSVLLCDEAFRSMGDADLYTSILHEELELLVKELEETRRNGTLKRKKV
ncbi:hypothetical protein Fcan01_17794 [Folsomia candida]|uniref:Uncharacterized protein n=1 Tax=Folsomia candida TaxID=158441 RepID=A0A226DTE9_FOLCA|nr:hypothetical protein Fcan01_17794 [Folsomia candida]